MKNLAIFGAGGLGRETAWMIHEINQANDTWDLLGFFDDGQPKGKTVDGLPVLGGMQEVNRVDEVLHLVIAIGDPHVRASVVEKIASHYIQYPILIHPAAHIGAPANVFGKGTLITAGVILTTGIRIGEHAIVNLACTIGHDADLGDYASLMPQCSISGNVQIGEKSFLGSGARILQGVSLGKNTIVGAGAVVTKSFPEGARLMGVPAENIPARR